MILWLAGLALAVPLDVQVLERGASAPILGATYTCTGPDGTQQTGSIQGGAFQLDLEPGATAICRILPERHIAETVELTVGDRPLRIFLDPLPPADEVVVESFRVTAHPTVHRVDAEQAYETPGTQDDAVRLTQSLPGVTVQREFAPTSGDLSVRGSAPGDNRYYLDGIEIPYLYHFNQYASVFPTTQLRRLELYPSTFGSAYGDAVGGIVEATSRTDRPTDVQGQITFNTIIAGADVRAPINEKWWFSVAGRRSYQDLYSSGSDQYTLWPVFHDTTVRLERGDDERGTGVFLTTAGDSYERAVGELDVLDPVESEAAPSFRFRRSFQVLGFRHRWSTPEGSGRWVVGLVHDRMRGNLGSEAKQEQRSLTLSSRLDQRRGFGSQLQHTWAAGGELRASATRLDVQGSGEAGVLVATEAPALARGDITDTVPRLEAAAYGEVWIALGDVRLMPGARLGVDSLTGAVLPEPRLAARWRVSEQTALKLAAGHYLQTPTLLDRIEGPGDPTLPLNRAWQASAGWEQTFAQRLELNVDVYGKQLQDATVARLDAPPEVFEVGRAYGVEVVTRYRLRERFFLRGWLGVARTQVQRPEGWAPTAYDQPLNLGLVASWDPTLKWNLAVRWRYGSGLPWTPLSGSLYDAAQDRWRPIAGTPWSERFPAYTKLDLVAGYRMTFDRWALSLRAELWYVPPKANVLYPTWNYDGTEQGWVRGIPLLPLLGARATF